MAALALLAAAASTVSALVTNDNPKPQPQQLSYQASISNDRLSLFDGDLYVRTDRTVEVADWFPVSVLICGQANSDDVCGAPIDEQGPGQSPTSMPSAATSAKMGARVGITLAAADDAIKIKDLGNGKDSTQPLITPKDYARWTWQVRAEKPGDYYLQAAVFVKAADGEAELVPRQSVTIRLSVKRTAGYTANQVWSSTRDFVKWILGTGLITAAGIGAWWAWTRRRVLRRRRARRRSL